MGLRPQYRTNGIRLLEENRGKFSWLRIWYGFSDMTSNQNISNKRKNKYTEFIKIQIFVLQRALSIKLKTHPTE